MGEICDVSVINLESHFKHSILRILRWVKTLPKFLKNLKILMHWFLSVQHRWTPSKNHVFFFSLSPSPIKKETEQEISLKQAVSQHFWQILIPTKLKIPQEQPVIQNFSASTPGNAEIDRYVGFKISKTLSVKAS